MPHSAPQQLVNPCAHLPHSEELWSVIARTTCKPVSNYDTIKDINRQLELPAIGVDDVVSVINRDSVLVARVLRVANNSVLCKPPVITLRDAVDVVGLSMIRSLALHVMLRDAVTFSQSDMADKMVAHEHRSLKLSNTMHAVCKSLTQLNPDVASLMGVLCNIGVPVVLKQIDDHIDVLQDLREASDVDIRSLGAQVGTSILTEWHVPRPIVDIITAKTSVNVIKLSDIRTYRHVYHISQQYIDGMTDRENTYAIDKIMHKL